MAAGTSGTPVGVTVRIQAQDFDIAGEIEALTGGRTDIGAVVSFTGLCRDEGGRLSALELEHYPGMAERAIRAIAEKAVTRFELCGITAIHRHGAIPPGGNIVLVVAAAPHRQAAFDGASFLMDYLKTDAPFWKKEHLKVGGAGEWVSAKDADDEAKAKWAEALRQSGQ
ncbi:MAG: molybdenum cofactor biosynthesis protein MoaE [Hoeflea sp.]|uniref:molybdenum cofactor biosynthesis protein MoaE n=1 Tax=Hoeflea sp. TaxID=1940281 RepID=UPI001D8F3768|nr:molybdenum cofactor biosynthesis protein MoaE [Hoeflea sp.]MBU4530091.1 molybdenum cofactor biosynthesis protein MoaE [Alphaproteobacteria bacterium]MBU4542624.1 molybdenum cofactor biosynthesis protein MoaE [Alphaproteobacteria bacterium]MBU4551305.1 molybdenum cofactor biosynthesis protein MoaE [Alphaproteobacteria bacterium]MBV1723128.1 molybdenum cofactor biosynthesis protein MoaE [Hoeflea sp.]MBV1760139.1 molybdenum cofactor biosynthesis protein MoaE [Hoeflea sp.]